MIDNTKEIDITIEKNVIKLGHAKEIDCPFSTNKNDEIKLTKT